jgi:hypothetical protein
LQALTQKKNKGHSFSQSRTIMPPKKDKQQKAFKNLIDPMMVSALNSSSTPVYVYTPQVDKLGHISLDAVKKSAAGVLTPGEKDGPLVLAQGVEQELPVSTFYSTSGARKAICAAGFVGIDELSPVAAINTGVVQLMETAAMPAVSRKAKGKAGEVPGKIRSITVAAAQFTNSDRLVTQPKDSFTDASVALLSADVLHEKVVLPPTPTVKSKVAAAKKKTSPAAKKKGTATASNGKKKIVPRKKPAVQPKKSAMPAHPKK